MVSGVIQSSVLLQRCTCKNAWQNYTCACPKAHARKAMSAGTHRHAEKYMCMRKPTSTHRRVHAQKCRCRCAQKCACRCAQKYRHAPKKSHVHAKPPHTHAEKQARMPLKTGARTKSCVHMQKRMRLCPPKSTHACTKIHMHKNPHARPKPCTHVPKSTRMHAQTHTCTH